jgi:anti-anti-sigma regulatory factor
MLRITVQDTPIQVVLKLEGSLVGTWVTELEEVWRTTKTSLANRSILLDLTAVDRIDRAGKYLLALLLERGVQPAASGLVVTEDIAAIVEAWQLRKDP